VKYTPVASTARSSGRFKPEAMATDEDATHAPPTQIWDVEHVVPQLPQLVAVLTVARAGLGVRKLGFPVIRVTTFCANADEHCGFRDMNRSFAFVFCSFLCRAPPFLFLVRTKRIAKEHFIRSI
jgi:hypothetical protein